MQVMNSEDDHQLQATLSIDVEVSAETKPLANVNMDNRRLTLTLYHVCKP